MSLPKFLYKTKITVWTDYDPRDSTLEDLAREAEVGDAYCESSYTEIVKDSSKFPDTEFFGVDEDDDKSNPSNEGE